MQRLVVDVESNICAMACTLPRGYVMILLVVLLNSWRRLSRGQLSNVAYDPFGEVAKKPNMLQQKSGDAAKTPRATAAGQPQVFSPGQ